MQHRGVAACDACMVRLQPPTRIRGAVAAAANTQWDVFTWRAAPARADREYLSEAAQQPAQVLARA